MDDFAPVSDFDITIPGDTGSAEGTFTLTPVDDALDEGAETVAVGGTATDGETIAVDGTTVTIDEASNRPPTFDERPTATRTVAENTAAGEPVGAPVTATDLDEDTLNYALGGPYKRLFAIDDETGQIRVGSDTVLDFEGAVRRYELTVLVTDYKDSAGEEENIFGEVDDTITITVEVADVAEPPVAPDAPTLTAGTTMIVDWDEPENDTRPPITDYDVHYRVVGATGWTNHEFEGTGTETTLTNLALGTAYEVRVLASNDEGLSGWSDSSFENTLARVALSVSATKPEIGTDDAAVEVTLTASAAVAGGGTLTGVWLSRDENGTITELEPVPNLTSGTSVTQTVSSSVPGTVTYGFRASHELEGRTNPAEQWLDITWRPRVVLGVQPGAVTEAGGAQTVTVTATLTGTAFTSTAKTVTVTVAGGTATVVDDFAAVSDFDITIPGDTGSATGTFTLTPVADALDEGAETVAVNGTATDGEAIAVNGTTVTITDAPPQLTVTAPDNGYVTGTDAAQATLIDCGSGGRADCTAMPVRGSLVTLTATADTGYAFTGWTGDCSGTGACTLTVDTDKRLGATFVALPGQPDPPTAMPTDDTTLTVTWSAPSETGSGIVDYKLQHSVAGEDNWTVIATRRHGYLVDRQ